VNIPDVDANRSDLVISLVEPGALLSLRGRLSARTVADVRAALVAAIADGSGDLIVDIAGVQLVDASGLGVLVGAHRLALRSERRLVLRDVPERVERLLALTHLNRVLSVETPVRV
jgi:anti-sigma B factor antagonist